MDKKPGKSEYNTYKRTTIELLQFSKLMSYNKEIETSILCYIDKRQVI